MCHRLVARDQLVKLSSWLNTKGPPTYKVNGHVRSHLLGKVECEVLVNSWPDPSVVLVTSDKNEGTYADLRQDHTTYTTNVDDLDQFLEQEHVFDWKVPSVFAGVCLDQAEVLRKHANKQGGKLQVNGPSYLLHNDPTSTQLLPGRDLPEDYLLSPLRLHNARTITDAWNLTGPGTYDYVKYLIEHFPNVGVVHRQKEELVAWGIVQDYWAFGMIHCLPDYRRFGFARTAWRNLQQQVHWLGYPGYTFVELQNNASLRLCDKLGLVKSGVQTAWMRYSPDICQ